jgi:hypothetical protein
MRGKEMMFMLKRIIALTLIFILFSLPGYAEIKVETKDHIPTVPYMSAYEEFMITGIKDIPRDAVVNEVYHLENALPVLKKANWTVNLFNRSIDTEFGEMGGMSIPGETYIFGVDKPELTQTLISHELGHLVQFEYIDLAEYGRTTDEDGYYNQPVEIFAEDFRWLFGSPEAKIIPYRSSLEPPGDKEKDFILNKLLKDYRDRLDYYTVNPVDGLKEINRSNNVYNEKILKGDIKGAEAANVWTNQIRDAIGLPIQN